jgi:hypothetical protein
MKGLEPAGEKVPNPDGAESLRAHQPMNRGTPADLINSILWMQKKPYREATIRSTLACMKSIANHSILENPESVREYIATFSISDNRKSILVDAAARYYDFKQIRFVKPIYRKMQKLPFIKLEREK